MPGALHAVEIPEEAEIEEQAAQADSGGGPDDAFIAAEVGIHRGGKEPELKDDEDEDEAEDPVDDGDALLARERSLDGHG